LINSGAVVGREPNVGIGAVEHDGYRLMASRRGQAFACSLATVTTGRAALPDASVRPVATSSVKKFDGTLFLSVGFVNQREVWS
jgi:hypothetical protein